MRIENYPRPRNDQGLGLLWKGSAPTLDPGHVLEQAGELLATWLVMPTSLDHPVPASALGALTRQLEVVVGIEESIGPLPQAELRSVLREYAHSGVHYLYLYRDPNQTASWSSRGRGEFLQGDLPQRFAQLISPSLDRVAEAGMIPLFSPLAAGGDYWDLAFLADALQHLRQRGPAWLDRLGLSISNHFPDRPLSWGRGGRLSSPQARPYHTPPGSQDHRGFYLFEWYDQVVQAQLGRSVALIATGYPAGAAAAQWIQEVIAWARSGARPEYFLMANLGPIDQLVNATSTGGSASLATQIERELVGPSAPVFATRPADGDGRPWLDTPENERHPAGTQEGEKAIEHYLLFPSWEWGISDWHWQLALNYVKRFRPTCGFELHEAARARRVTILGAARWIDESTERQLRAQGCRVERIPGEDAAQLKAALDELADSGRRFINEEEQDGR